MGAFVVTKNLNGEYMLDQENEQFFIRSALSVPDLKYVRAYEILLDSHYIVHDLVYGKNRIVKCIQYLNNGFFMQSLSTGDVLYIPFDREHEYVNDTLVPIVME